MDASQIGLMAEAKTGGKNRWHFFHESVRARTLIGGWKKKPRFLRQHRG